MFVLILTSPHFEVVWDGEDGNYFPTLEAAINKANELCRESGYSSDIVQYEGVVKPYPKFIGAPKGQSSNNPLRSPSQDPYAYWRNSRAPSDIPENAVNTGAAQTFYNVEAKPTSGW